MDIYLDDYWHNWNRVVGSMANGRKVIVRLTPINFSTHEWNYVRGENLLVNNGPNHKCKRVETLPDTIRAMMVMHLGEELTHRLLSHDYMCEVTAYDVDRACRASNGGGVPLQFVKDFRDGVKIYHHND